MEKNKSEQKLLAKSKKQQSRSKTPIKVDINNKFNQIV
jgi:hypothetical protein